MEGLQLPSGSELAHFTQPDGTTIKTLELSREYFEEDEHGVEVFARAVTALNDEDGMILDEATTNFLYLVQVHNTYKFFDSMAIKLRKELGCPLIKRFWEKRDSPEAFKKRNDNAIHTDFRWSQSGPTKAQKFKDKGVVVLSRRGLRVLVPCIGLLLPEEVDFRELIENIALANSDVLDARTMAAVLKGVVKNVWFDSLPSIKRRRDKEILEIEAAANDTHSVSKPYKNEPNGEAKSSDPLPSVTDPSSESHSKAEQGVPSTKRSRPSRWGPPLDSLNVPSSRPSTFTPAPADITHPAPRHRDLDRVIHGRVEHGQGRLPNPTSDTGSTPPYISRPSSASEISNETSRSRMSSSGFPRTWTGRKKERYRRHQGANCNGGKKSEHKQEQRNR